ncbi:hypothetical protein BDR07DRAFT_1485382 [Suillus spraguei]|nr:hypothetical protein BDR07DRAFT_1485382 [Suillus spraguei]
MARPTLYKTHQARLQAAREKRRRHYQKFRESILAKRRQSRKEKNLKAMNLRTTKTIQSKPYMTALLQLNKSIFEHAITRLEDFLDQANHRLDGILQMCGVSDEWRAADGVCRFMREMIGMIEDILLRLAEGRDGELSITFMGNELWYQEYKFPV